jgi:hypothetical protein
MKIEKDPGEISIVNPAASFSRICKKDLKYTGLFPVD